jgi:hypothetical protein
VGDDDGGPARAQALQGVGDAGLAGRVQVGGGLVQDQQGRVGDPGPGEGDQLALPGRQQRAPLADLGVVAVGQAGDDPVGPDGAGGRLDLGPGRLGPAEADVVQDRAREQESILWELVLLRVPERADLGVQVGADPADLALLMPLSAPSAGSGPPCVVSVRENHWRGLAGHRKVVTHAVAAGYLHHLRDTTGGRNRRLIPADVFHGCHGPPRVRPCCR